MSSSRAPLLSSACTAHATPPPRCLLGLNKPLLLEPPPRGQAPLAGCLGQTPGSPAHRLQPSCQVQLETHPLPSGSPTPQVWPFLCAGPTAYTTARRAVSGNQNLRSLPLRQSKRMHALTPPTIACTPCPCLTFTDSLARPLSPLYMSQIPLSGEGNGQDRDSSTQVMHLRLLAWLQYSTWSRGSLLCHYWGLASSAHLRASCW